MKKNDVIDGIVEEVIFPNKAVIIYEDNKVIVKNGLKGQRLRVKITKKRRDKIQGKIIEVIENSPFEKKPLCQHFSDCGGCTYQNLRYKEQLRMKESQVRKMIDSVTDYYYNFEHIEPSPTEYGYRNKMEFSFGDAVKGGELCLGMHKRGSYHDIVTSTSCQIVDKDFRKLVTVLLRFFKNMELPFYHKRTHEGYLRHLVIRRSSKTDEIMINIVTTSQMDVDLQGFVDKILSIKLAGEVKSIVHTINDSIADVVQADEIHLLYGRDYIIEELMGLKFKISPFSFFQTNSLGAEALYSIVKGFIGYKNDKIIFDLYSGTGTIAQILASKAKKVYGIEIVKEAVDAARENAKLNKLTNCEFVVGDVLKKIDEMYIKPDVVIVDPPRPGIHKEAIKKIAAFEARQIIYVSCNPKSLVEDLKIFYENGYELDKVKCVDMFPHTPHVETVVKLNMID